MKGIILLNNENEVLLPYRVGGLMYTPALNKGVAQKIKEKAYPQLSSLALCLEDSISDYALEDAERQARSTLQEIMDSTCVEDRPLLFVRIRNPEHMERIHTLLGETEAILTGYILPKFDLDNAGRYIDLLDTINREKKTKLYIMPTLESGMVADAATRVNALMRIKAILDPVRKQVINIRVGGNDFSNIFGLRRKVTQTIYDVGVIRDILADIVNVFSRDYVVSGPVWEYFGSNPHAPWAVGLRRELKLDLLNGFIGKTAIHPSQLPVIYESMKVSRDDYEDALAILAWNRQGYAVAKSEGGTRMNEVKCHTRWAEKICCLGSIYGISEDEV